MAYQEEYKKEILEQMKAKTIKEISKVTGISKDTLYNWKKKDYQQVEDEIEKKDNNLKRYKGEKEDWDYRRGLSLYKDKKYEEAIVYFKRSIEKQNEFLERSIFFIGKIYSIQGRTKEAEEQFKKCIEIEPDNTIIRKMLIEMDKASETQNKQISNISIKSIEQKQGNILTGIRAKIYVGTIKNTDVQEIQEMMQDLEQKQYYLIQIAAYEKLGQKNNALKVVKQMEVEGIKVKEIGAIKDRLKSKKPRIFDLDKWDKLIGWDVARTEQYEEEERKKQQENIQKEEKEKIIKPNNDKEEVLEQSIQEKKKEKSTKKPKSIITNIGTTAKKDGRKEETKKKIKKEKSKLETQKDTISSTMSETVKKVIDEISRNYYVKMQPHQIQQKNTKEYQQLLKNITDANAKDKKRMMQLMQQLLQDNYEEKTTQQKYIKKYDKLQSILECDKNNKRAQMELMLVLINEGYRKVAKLEFPEEDYEFIDKIIKQYYTKSVKPQDARKKIDEYCME